MKTNGRLVGNERETGQSKTRVLFVRLLSARRKSRQETSANTIPATFAPDDSLHEFRARIKCPSLMDPLREMEIPRSISDTTQERLSYRISSLCSRQNYDDSHRERIFEFLKSFLKKSQEQLQRRVIEYFIISVHLFWREVSFGHPRLLSIGFRTSVKLAWFTGDFFSPYSHLLSSHFVR